jgi:hypothetical protein
MEKIRWAAKVRQEKLLKLYRTDALGLIDEDLLADVGSALLARCESILLIAEGKVACPRCQAVFVVRPPLTKGGAEPVVCITEGCGWQVSVEAYDHSIRHRELQIGYAGPAFTAYWKSYPKARTAQERMFAIDRLIHAFHWDLKAQLPNRPAGNNLIEGSLEQVIDLLDCLSYGSNPQAQAEWRETVGVMMRRRRGKRAEPSKPNSG